MSNTYTPESWMGAGTLRLGDLDSNFKPIALSRAGCLAELSLQANAEVSQQQCRDVGSYGNVVATAVKPQPASGTMVLEQTTRTTLAAMMFGEDKTIADESGTVTGELVPVPSEGQQIKVAYRDVTSVAVDRVNGVNASTWAASFAYTEGTFAYDSDSNYTSSGYVVPTVANDHFYKCTTAGTSDSTEPVTWPIDGTTVTDGTVVWQDMGTIEAALNVDYSIGIEGAELGILTPISTGSFEFGIDGTLGEQLSIDYAYAARSGYIIEAGGVLVVDKWIHLFGQNLDTLAKEVLTVHRAKLMPNGPVNYLSDDWRTATFDIYPQLVPDGSKPIWTVDKTTKA